MRKLGPILTDSLFFVLAASADFFSVKWHNYREKRFIVRGAATAGILELLGWAPLYVAITEEDVSILVASVLGSMVGSAIGFKYETH